MADKASRGLVIYGDGLMPHISLGHHPNLHSFAARASCGFLYLRDPTATATPKSEDERVVIELAQLLDVHDAYTKEHGGDIDADLEFQKKCSLLTISERFMGLRSAFFTNCSRSGSLARNLGFSLKSFDELTKNSVAFDVPQREVPDSFSVVTELLKLLGFQEGKIMETSEFDLVFVHVADAENLKGLKDQLASRINLEWVDEVVGGVMQIAAQPGSEISSRLHVSIVMGYGGSVLENEHHGSLISIDLKATDSDLSSLFPCQSYTMREGTLLMNIRRHHPLLIAQWQEAVTRRDMAREFSFEEFDKHGGNLAILADRFLYEVAFKLWKAPKYGA